MRYFTECVLALYFEEFQGKKRLELKLKELGRSLVAKSLLDVASEAKR